MTNDQPKMLRSADARASRLLQLHEAHVAPLTALVEQLRTEVGPEKRVPYFDPWDGGVTAQVLFLLEAPGSKAIESGFVSRNNPDETAKNFFELSQRAGIERKMTLMWNAVPWYRKGPPTNAELKSSLSQLDRLFQLLGGLRAVVLVGKKAQSLETYLKQSRPDLRQFSCPHPSPTFVNRNRSVNTRQIFLALARVAEYLCSDKRPVQEHDSIEWEIVKAPARPDIQAKIDEIDRLFEAGTITAQERIMRKRGL